MSLQLFGSDPDIIAEIAHQIEDRPFDILEEVLVVNLESTIHISEFSLIW